MRAILRLCRRAWYLVNRRRIERELDEEIRAHQDMMPDAARFGNVTRVRENVGDVVGWTLLDDVRRDASYTSRTLLRQPGFIVAVLSLGLAIGATAAVYSTADWLLRRSPGGVIAPDELVTLRITEGGRTDLAPYGYGLSYPQFRALGEVQDTFTGIATYGKLVGVVSTDNDSDQVVVEYVSGTYFPLLGVRPQIGRLIGPDDDVAGAPANVVLSHQFWLSRFGGDPGVLGRTLRINGVSTRIVGVMPSSFVGYAIDWNGPTSIWAALDVGPSLGNPGLTRANSSFFPVIGRMKRGVTAATVLDRGPAWLKALPALKMPAWNGTQILVRPTSETRIGSRDAAAEFLGVLLIVCVLILLAACINLANVLLGRAMSRRREFSLRTALGAGRRRLIGQVAIEATCIGVVAGTLGAIVGVGVAWGMATLPKAYLGRAATTPLTTFGAIDVSLLELAFGIGVAAALLFGFLPLLPTAMRQATSVARDAPPRWRWGRIRMSTRQLVLVGQVAMVIALAATAGLYGRTFSKAAAIRPPYEKPESVLVARVALTALPVPQREALWAALLDRLKHEPGVVGATVGWNPPYRIGFTRLQIPGGDPKGVQVSATAGAPGFFAVQGIPVVEGREFAASGEDFETGIIINRILANQLWPGQSAVGRQLAYSGTPRTITGVVADDQCGALLEEPGPCSWSPWPANSGTSYLRIRTAGDPMQFVPRLRAVLRELTPYGAIAEAASLDAMFREFVEPQRNAALIAAGLATFGVVLLIAGTVSLFLAMVRDSRRDIAVRMAVGATHGVVVRRIMLHGASLVVVGSVLGVAGAYYLAQQIEGQLFRVAPTDSLSLIVIPLVVALVSTLSVAVAASEAARTDLAPHLQAQ